MKKNAYFCKKIVYPMIKKGYIAFILTAFCSYTPSFAHKAHTLSAHMNQTDATPSFKDLFLKMPQEVCPNLSEYNRLEIIDNQKNNKPLETRNLFQGISKMNVLTDTFASLTITENSEKSFKLLPLNDGKTVIAVVTTIHADGKSDSSIDFYDTEWNHLDAQIFINEPTSKEFRSIVLSQDDNTLTITTSNAMAITIDGSSNKPKPTSETVTLSWNGNRFE